MNNDKKPNQPMYMRASVSNAFENNLQPKYNVFISMLFVVFVFGIIALAVWLVFFEGVESIKTLINEFLSPGIEK